MVTNKSIIGQEMDRFSAMSLTARPLGAGRFRDYFPNGPDGLVVVTGRDADELVRAFELTIREFRNRHLTGAAALIEAPNLKRKHLNEIQVALFSLNTRHTVEVYDTKASAEEESRVSLFIAA